MSTSNAPAEKPAKYAVALAIRRNDGAFLTIRRPDDDPSLPGVWGLPATIRRPEEPLEEAAMRVGRQKLGVTVELGRYLGEDVHERRTFILHLAEFEATIVDGTPAVPQPDISGTQYVELDYSNDPSILIPAARVGSVCSRIFLRSNGIEWADTADAETLPEQR